MLSKNTIKLIRQLSQKKYRKEYNLFIIEGEKMLLELLDSNFEIKEIFAVTDLFEKLNTKNIPKSLISEKELNQISQLKTPNKGIAIVNIPKTKSKIEFSEGLYLALDNIQDPGNMGTIIRTANWFGVSTIFCSNNCVDIYNSKVVQATMGALLKTKIVYTDLKSVFSDASKKNLPIYGTSLDGENFYKKKLNTSGIIVMGNEGKGLSKEIESYVSEKILIPTYPENRTDNIESLNVAVATSVILAEFRRQS